tara:strand:+ start:49 stop:567 length:519 start_codon:yes stop_codon:yes gene_type:complete
MNLRDKWIEWNLNHPKDQIDWSEFREEHEERKAKKKAYDKTRLDYKKAHYKANRERILVRQNAYDEANREAISIRKKIYNDANKDKRKAYYEAQKLPHYIVYCLPHYNKHGYIKYAGVTDNPHHRMKRHKQLGNNTDEWFVLHECETKKEALKIEREYHKKGYAGKKGFKNK